MRLELIFRLHGAGRLQVAVGHLSKLTHAGLHYMGRGWAARSRVDVCKCRLRRVCGRRWSRGHTEHKAVALLAPRGHGREQRSGTGRRAGERIHPPFRSSRQLVSSAFAFICFCRGSRCTSPSVLLESLRSSRRAIPKQLHHDYAFIEQQRQEAPPGPRTLRNDASIRIEISILRYRYDGGKEQVPHRAAESDQVPTSCFKSCNGGRPAHRI